MQTELHNHQDPFLQPDAARRARAAETFWTSLGILYRWRRFIIGVTGVVAILAVVLSLLMSNWYQAEARLVLPPRGGTGLATALMENLPAAARSFIGSGGGGDYFRYLTILTSRTVNENVVDHFDLVNVYDVADSETPGQSAREMLSDNVEFPINDEFEFLSVRVLDTDPQRAADMANYYVSELQRLNSELASQSARYFRRFVESRYNETIASLDSVQNAIRAFQEAHGVLNLEVQGEQFLQYIAELRLSALQAEGEYEVLRSQFGPENSTVQAARQAAQLTNRKYQQALAGQEQLLPVAQSKLPEIALAYSELERERLILATLIEYIRPLLEEARFDEERTIEAVQVIDVAVPPAKKAKPRRSIICIMATLSAFLLASVFAFLFTWWQNNHTYYARRLQAAVAASEQGTDPHAPDARETTASKPLASS